MRWGGCERRIVLLPRRGSCFDFGDVIETPMLAIKKKRVHQEDSQPQYLDSRFRLILDTNLTRGSSLRCEVILYKPTRPRRVNELSHGSDLMAKAVLTCWTPRSPPKVLERCCRGFEGPQSVPDPDTRDDSDILEFLLFVFLGVVARVCLVSLAANIEKRSHSRWNWQKAVTSLQVQDCQRKLRDR